MGEQASKQDVQHTVAEWGKGRRLAGQEHAPTNDGDEKYASLGYEFEGAVQMEQREDVLRQEESNRMLEESAESGCMKGCCVSAMHCSSIIKVLA